LILKRDVKWIEANVKNLHPHPQKCAQNVGWKNLTKKRHDGR
jgi:hypothetical protein